MQTKYYVSVLMIEVTRRCNFCCAHCCRGDQENMDLDVSCLEALLGRVSGIGNLIFTGGEPSLAVNIIKQCREMLELRGIAYSGFYIATNGTGNYNEEFALECMRLYGSADEKDACAIDISNSDNHELGEAPDKGLLGALSFVNYKYHDRKAMQLRNEALVGEGYAAGYGLGTVSHDGYMVQGAMDSEYRSVEGMVYLNCEGMVMDACDMSYESQRKAPFATSASAFWDKIDALPVNE